MQNYYRDPEQGEVPRIRERAMSGFRTSAKFPQARVKDLKLIYQGIYEKLKWMSGSCKFC